MPPQYFRLKGPYSQGAIRQLSHMQVSPYRQLGALQTSGTNRRCAIHTDKGPIQTRGPYTDKGPIYSQGAHIQTRGPYRQEAPTNMGPIQGNDIQAKGISYELPFPKINICFYMFYKH